MSSRADQEPSSKRWLIAGLLTALFVAPFEIVSFYRGEYPGYYAGVLGVPLIVALLSFKSLKSRLIAWLALTIISVITSFTVIVGLWFA